MNNETKPMQFRKERIGKRERLYFLLLLLSTLMTGCGLIVGMLVLGTTAVFLLALVIFLLGVVWIRQWVRVMTIWTEGVFLSEKQQPVVYAALRQDAEQMGFRKIPEVVLTKHPTITRPRTIGLFQKYMLVLPADYPLDESTRFEILRELAHLKQNHEEKRFMLLPGSWVPFLRAAYLRACEETADQLALGQLAEADRVPALIHWIVGPELWRRLDVLNYIEQKQQQSLAATVSELFRHQPSAHRRFASTGLKTTSPRFARVTNGLLVSLSCLLLAGLVFIATELEIPQLSDWTQPVVEQNDTKQDLGESKLMAAIQKGTLDEINELIPESDMKAVDADGDTALHYLGYRKSSEGLEDIFKALLAAGSDVDTVNEFGERPFITAAYSNNKELVELYLKRGEKINQQDDEKYTPLHHAVEGEGKETVKLLLERGADPALKNADGYTPLMMAEEYELEDIIVLLKQNQTQSL